MLEPGGSKRVELMLDYFPNADHAGIYAAQAAGYFEEAGLDVEIRTPPDPAAPIKQVAAGNVDLAISYEPEVFRAREIGLNVVSIGALVQEPLTSIISLPKAKIRAPKDLEGKTVGTAGHRLPDRLPRDDPRRSGRQHRHRQGAQRRLQPHARAADRPGRRDARRVLELRGHRAPCAARSRRSSAWRRPACRPTTSSCWWPTRTRSSATAASSARSSARSRAGRASCARTPRRPSRGCSTRIPISIRGSSGRSSR